MKHIELNNEVRTQKDGFFQLDKDKEAIDDFLLEVYQKRVPFHSVIERMQYMIEQHYYEDVFQSYTQKEIVDIHELLDSYHFQFQSYMAASKFYRDYGLKTDDKEQYLETYEERIAMVALHLGRGDIEQAKRLAVAMIEQRYQPATPTFLNAGRARRGELVSCFLLEVADSLNAITFNVGTAMQLSKIGGGTALNLSKLRGRGEPIKGVENAAKGVMPVMKLLEDSFSYADQMGQRKGAGAVYLNIFHWDVIEFLDAKKINADEKARIQSLSVGLVVPDKLFQLAENDEPLYVFAPYTVEQAYGQPLDELDMDQMYEALVQNPDVGKKKLEFSAREMLTKIATTQLESGYPYIIFKTNANRQHPLKGIGQIKMSNLCTEIFQLQEGSEITDYDEENNIQRDISCNLGSLNIANVMASGQMKNAVHAGMEALTAVADMTSVKNAPSVRKANDELHSVGLGAMNLHGYLAKNRIPYESGEAKDFVRTFFMAVNYYSIEKSMLIAKERGETFKDFAKSDYADGTYFEKYVHTDFHPQTEKVKGLFADMALPTKADWEWLRQQVAQFGLYHAYRLAIAPNQSIGYIQNATPSVMPAVGAIEVRTYANSTTYYPMPFLSPETFWYYKSAYDMDQLKIIDLMAEIQEHVDQGISTILYVKSDVSTRDLARYYIYANKKGLKSLYYTRTQNQTVEECLACSV